MNYGEITRETKTMVWGFGVLKELVNLGVLSEGRWGITPKGISYFDQIYEDFTPTNAELIFFCTSLIIIDCLEESEKESLFLFMTVYRDDKEKFLSWVDKYKDKNNL